MLYVVVTTEIRHFAECQLHSAKSGFHSAKYLPSVTLGKPCDGEGGFAESQTGLDKMAMWGYGDGDFAEGLTVGSRQRFKLRRVPAGWHSAKI